MKPTTRLRHLVQECGLDFGAVTLAELLDALVSRKRQDEPKPSDTRQLALPTTEIHDADDLRRSS